MKIPVGLTVLPLLVGGVMMAAGMIAAKIAKMVFYKRYAPTLPQDTAKSHGDVLQISDMGVSGTLLGIGTFSSRARKSDGTAIGIPSEEFLASNSTRSLTLSTVRRAEATVGIAYEDGIAQAIAAIGNEARLAMPFVLTVPEPDSELGNWATQA